MNFRSRFISGMALYATIGGLVCGARGADSPSPASQPRRPTPAVAPNPGGARVGSPPASRPAASLVRFQPGGGRGSIVRLSVVPEVLEDLQLNDAQKEGVLLVAARLKAFEAQFAEALKRAPAVPAGSGAEGQWVAARQAEANQALAQARAELVKALPPAHVQRLEQIALQELSAEALFRPDIAQQLNLTPVQRTSLVRLRSGDAAAPTPTSGPAAGPARVPPAPITPGARTATAAAAVGSATAGARTGTNAPALAKPTPPAPRAASGATAGARGGAGVPEPIPPDLDRKMLQEVLTPQQRSQFRELQGRPIQMRSRPEEVWKQEF